jgi:hypothetical protein
MTERKTMDPRPLRTREIAASVGVEIGCGDNSCRFGYPGGQATNGGCRCLPTGRWLTEDTPKVMTLVGKLAQVIQALAEKARRA